MQKSDIPSHERLGLARTEAAQYVGISPGLFDVMVQDGRMPPAKIINCRKVWPRLAIERAFADLPDDDSHHSTSDGPWRNCAA